MSLQIRGHNELAYSPASRVVEVGKTFGEEDIGIQNSPSNHVHYASTTTFPGERAIMHIKRYQHACESCIRASRILKMKSCKILYLLGSIPLYG